MSKTTRLVSWLLVHSGIAAMGDRVRRRSQTPRMTILTYHRIGEAVSEMNPTDPKMISASPAGLEWQIGYLSRHYTILSLKEVIDLFNLGSPLPHQIAALTFDDGYQDNYSLAYPILHRYNTPATIFLTTGFVGTSVGKAGGKIFGSTNHPMWWDEIAYLISTTRSREVTVPNLGTLSLSRANDRSRAREKLRRYLKSLDEDDRRSQVDALRNDLACGQGMQPDIPAPLTWEEAREMSRNGIVFGSHTHSHPILTGVSIEEAEREIRLSKEIIENELGTSVDLFAYPNGKKGDFDARIQKILVQSGFKAAVTLMHGSNRLTRDQLNWYALRRIYVGNDDRATFIAKVTGALEMFDPRLISSPERAH